MKVEVEASDITALEQQAQQLAQLLTVAVAKRSKKTLTVTDKDLQDTAGATIITTRTDDGVVLTYKAP